MQRTGGNSSSRMQWKKMHCSVCSVSSIAHVTALLPVQDLAPASCRAGGRSSPCRRHLPKTSLSSLFPGFVFGFVISDFGPSLIYVLVWVSPDTEPEPLVYLRGVGDLGRRITKEGKADNCGLWSQQPQMLTRSLLCREALGKSVNHIPQNYPPQGRGSWNIYISIPDSLWLRTIPRGWDFPSTLVCHLLEQSSFSWFWEMKPLGTGCRCQQLEGKGLRDLVGALTVCRRLPSLARSSVFHTWLRMGQSHTVLGILEFGNEEAEWVSVSSTLFVRSTAPHCLNKFRLLWEIMRLTHQEKWTWVEEKNSIGF